MNELVDYKKPTKKFDNKGYKKLTKKGIKIQRSMKDYLELYEEVSGTCEGGNGMLVRMVADVLKEREKEVERIKL